MHSYNKSIINNIYEPEFPRWLSQSHSHIFISQLLCCGAKKHFIDPGQFTIQHIRDFTPRVTLTEFIRWHNRRIISNINPTLVVRSTWFETHTPHSLENHILNSYAETAAQRSNVNVKHKTYIHFKCLTDDDQCIE